MTVVLVLGVLAGAALALLLYLIRPTFDKADTIKDMVGVPVLGVVSMVYGLEWDRRQRYALVAYGLAVIGLLAAYGGAMAVSGFDPNKATILQEIAGRG
jgi:hypothetical protein